jgi:hypothetical protein
MANAPTAALRRAWASAPHGVFLVETLELSHPLFSKVWRLVNAMDQVVATLEGGGSGVFQPVAFQVQLPPSDAQGGQLLTVVVANFGRIIRDEIEAAAKDPDQRMSLTYRLYLSNALTEPQTAPIKLSVDTIAMTNESITLQAGRSDTLNMPFPSTVYDIVKFPGLDR